MIKILRGEEIKALDASHLKASGQTSIDLMESAAKAFCTWFRANFAPKGKIAVWCGAGNNGGDGFAIARILSEKGYEVQVKCCFENSAKLSPDAERNFDRLPNSVPVGQWDDHSENSEILIDAFLGVGLKGELRETAKAVVKKMNQVNARKISVDIPSGLLAEKIGIQDVFEAGYTVSFAQPKLSLLLPENEMFTGHLVVLDIGISSGIYHDFDSKYYYLTRNDIPNYHKSFGRFSHKGDYGKVMLVGGSEGKMGAILLSGRSAFRTGTGLLYLNVDQGQNLIAQLGLIEAMTTTLSQPDLSGIDALGIGPGWGRNDRIDKLTYLFQHFTGKMVLDADALNLIAENPDLIERIPENSILTPHLKEFDRIAGPSENQLVRWGKARELSCKHSLILVLKGANTLISLPDGRQIFNSSGNQYMATAGSGDVLTGMITSFLGQGYSPENATICGVFHHGLAGEIASKVKRRGMMAGDLIEAIPQTFIELGIK